MKKIMFNDRFGLTEKVLDGNKTQTRRIIPQSVIDKVEEFRVEYYNMTFDALTTKESLYHYFFVEKNLGKLPYNVGEIVAVAQSYKEVFGEGCGKESEAGYNNKMFIKANLMPHHIKIERVRVERLQDISEEDCIKEGVCFHDNPSVDHKYDPYTPWPYYVKPYRHDIDNIRHFCKARFAYAYLIDKINGKGTWEANPWVFAYYFKLIK